MDVGKVTIHCSSYWRRYCCDPGLPLCSNQDTREMCTGQGKLGFTNLPDFCLTWYTGCKWLKSTRVYTWKVWTRLYQKVTRLQVCSNLKWSLLWYRGSNPTLTFFLIACIVYWFYNFKYFCHQIFLSLKVFCDSIELSTLDILQLYILPKVNTDYIRRIRYVVFLKIAVYTFYYTL